MDRELKLEAGALEIALNWDFIELNDVIRWADRQIEPVPLPDDNLIRLSLAKSKGDAMTLLKDILGPFDEWRVLKSFLKKFSNLEVLEPKLASKISGLIYRKLSLSAACPAQNEFGNFWSLCDDIDLAIDGITGDPNKISAEILNEIKQLAL